MTDPKKAGDTPCDCATTGYVCDDHHGRLNESRATPASSDVAERVKELREAADPTVGLLLQERCDRASAAADMIERLERGRDDLRRQLTQMGADDVAMVDLQRARAERAEAERDAAIKHVTALLACHDETHIEATRPDCEGRKEAITFLTGRDSGGER